MSLVERLGYKSLRDLLSNLDNNEIMEWSAYDKLQDYEWRKNYDTEVALDRQKNQTPEEEAERIKAMFMGLGKK